MTYQHGDRIVSFRGQDYLLRLTLSSLAEISIRLGAKGPKALAAILKDPDKDILRKLLVCVGIPKNVLMSDDEIEACHPALLSLFEESFSDG